MSKQPHTSGPDTHAESLRPTPSRCCWHFFCCCSHCYLQSGLQSWLGSPGMWFCAMPIAMHSCFHHAERLEPAGVDLCWPTPRECSATQCVSSGHMHVLLFHQTSLKKVKSREFQDGETKALNKESGHSQHGIRPTRQITCQWSCL